MRELLRYRDGNEAVKTSTTRGAHSRSSINNAGFAANCPAPIGFYAETIATRV